MFHTYEDGLFIYCCAQGVMINYNTFVNIFFLPCLVAALTSSMVSIKKTIVTSLCSRFHFSLPVYTTSGTGFIKPRNFMNN